MTTQTEAQRVKFATPDAGTTIEFLKAIALISARDTEWQSITSYQQRTLEKMQDDYAARIAELEAANAELLEALSFYADSTRYHGPNQSLNEPDKWSDRVGLNAYRLDVTRDGCVIARAAIAKNGSAV